MTPRLSPDRYLALTADEIGRAARALIGLVPQELTTDAFESVWATVSFSRGLFGKPRDPAMIERVLRQLSLWDKRSDKIMTLSGGMKRRVMIAKALSHEPQILFLDEPTAGVDVELRRAAHVFTPSAYLRSLAVSWGVPRERVSVLPNPVPTLGELPEVRRNGRTLAFAGRLTAQKSLGLALEAIEKAMRLNPYHPERFWSHLGRAYFVARRYPEAIEAFKHISSPDQTHHAFLAACYVQLGDAVIANGHAAEVLRQAPDFRASRYLATLHYKNNAQSDLFVLAPPLVICWKNPI